MEEKVYGQENFNLPHDVVTLPSGGKFYKNKKKTVKVGYLTANDENLLVNATRNGGKGLINQLVRSKLYEPDLRPDELLDGDIETILIFLRNTSFGPEYNLNLVDPQTGSEFKATIRLDELNFIKPEVEADENGHYTTKLPKSGATVKLRPLSYGEIQDIDNMAQNYPGGLIPPRVTWKLQKQIVEVNGSVDMTEINKLISTMLIMDSKYISNFLDRNEPRVDLNREVVAPSGKKVSVRVTFGAEFFRPFF